MSSFPLNVEDQKAVIISYLQEKGVFEPLLPAEKLGL